MYKYSDKKGKIILPREQVPAISFDIELLEHLEPVEREWILSFINKIKSKNPNWNFNLLYCNLSTISFHHDNFLPENCTGIYDIKKNRITYSKPTSIFHELLHASTSIKIGSQYYCGLEQIKKKILAHSIGKGINEGYTNYLESKYDTCYGWYVPEMEIVKNLNKAVPCMEEYYNNMDLLGLITYLERYFSKKDVLNFIEMVDYIYKYGHRKDSSKQEELKDIYYETQLYTYSCLIKKLIDDIDNERISIEDAQKQLNMAIILTLSNLMIGGNLCEVKHLERLQRHIPDLGNITSEDAKIYKLK